MLKIPGFLSLEFPTIYFCKIENYPKNIDEDELQFVHRWENHGRPPGGDVRVIADTGKIRPGILFTVRYINIITIMFQ